MKKTAFVLIALLVLFSFVPVRAMETQNYTGTARPNYPWVLDIVTQRVGDLTAHITWVPKKNVNYVFQVFHYTDPTNDYTIFNSLDYAYYCFLSTYNLVPPGDWICHFANAPVGYYRIYFRPYNNSVSFSLSLVAETNP